MEPKPRHWAQKYGSVFEDRGVAEAYVHRPPYPDEVFDVLLGLLPAESRTVLELGCGTSEIARRLAPEVDRVDAVDPSRAMIAVGEKLEGGDHKSLNWIPASAETFDYPVPYGLIVVARSIHWMDWEIVFLAMQRALAVNGRLAIIDSKADRGAWDRSTLGAIISRHSTNQDFQHTDLLAELERRELFVPTERITTKPVHMHQSLDSYIEFYHSMSGLSRERMGADAAAAFDDEVRAVFAPHAKDGKLQFEVTVEVAWCRPLALG